MKHLSMPAFALLSMIFSSAAHADHYWGEIDEYVHVTECSTSVPIIKDALYRTDVISSTACSLYQPLAMTCGEHSYPLMKDISPLEVTYWVGGYSRVAMVKNTYVHQYYDACSGEYLRTDPTPVAYPPVQQTLTYDIDNPNLHDDVQYSFATLPMTDVEAQASLEDARQQCEQAASESSRPTLK